MRRKCLAGWLLGALLLATAPSVAAWNDAGHMLAALITYDRLSDDTRENALALLARHPRFDEDFIARMPSGVAQADAAERSRWLFAAASTWPDYARAFDRVLPETSRPALVIRYHHSRWHYINQPIYLDDMDKAALGAVRTNDALELRANMPTEAMNLVQAILKAEQDLSAPISGARRAVALCWLLHLMGDLHQPLHTVALYTQRAFPEGDRGGNLIAVGERETLHSAWDGAAARDRRWGAVKRTYAALPAAALPADEVVDVGAWARDGAALASSTVYVGSIRDAVRGSVAPAGSTIAASLPVGYLAAMRAAARHGITLAGVRTARVLQPLLAQLKKAA